MDTTPDGRTAQPGQVTENVERPATNQSGQQNSPEVGHAPVATGNDANQPGAPPSDNANTVDNADPAVNVSDQQSYLPAGHVDAPADNDPNEKSASPSGSNVATEPSAWSKFTTFFRPIRDWLHRMKKKLEPVLDWLQDSWALEITACGVVLLLFGGEIGLLASFAGKQVTDWPFFWSLNSAVALLTTFIEAMLVFAISSCLGQLKWLWFLSSDDEEMEHLEWLESVARSNTAAGALLLLLWNGKIWPKKFFKLPVWLGAFIVLALLGISLFSQNVITYDFKDVKDSMPVFLYTTKVYQDALASSADMDREEQGVSAFMMLYGIFGFAFMPTAFSGYQSTTRDDLSLQGLHECPAGTNCTFEAYTTLQMRAECIDMPSDDLGTDSGRYTWSNETLTLDIQNGVFNMTSDTQYPKDDGNFNLTSIGPLIVRYLAMAQVPEEKSPLFAVECVAYWCTETYNASVINGTWAEQVVDPKTYSGGSVTNYSNVARTSYGQTNDIVLQPETCWRSGKQFNTSENCTFKVSANAQLGLQNFLSEGYANVQPFLRGSGAIAGVRNSWRTTSIAANLLSASCGANWAPCASRLRTSLNTSFPTMTNWMSNAVRRTSMSFEQRSRDPYLQRTTEGTSTTTQLHYRIRWGWIAYPAAVLLLSCIFVWRTVRKSRNMHPWKLSILPALFHSLRSINETELGQLSSPAEMRRKAETLLAGLEELDDPAKRPGQWKWRTG